MSFKESLYFIQILHFNAKHASNVLTAFVQADKLTDVFQALSYNTI